MYKHIIIRFALGGAIVRVGCQKIPFTSREKLKQALCDYIDNPDETEKKFLADDWARHDDEQTCEALVKEV